MLGMAAADAASCRRTVWGIVAWNGQLRQTIPLVSGDAMVAQAPLEGFLHQRSELDTLGLDQPESTCEAFR